MFIRQKQLDVFSREAVRSFEEMMLTHLQLAFPDHYDAHGSERLLQLIRCGIDRARSHGFSAQPEVASYIDLMVFFGADFDRDSTDSWATNALRCDTQGDARARMARLVDEALTIARAKSTNADPTATVDADRMKHQELLAFLRHNLPHEVSELSDQDVLNRIRRSEADALPYGISRTSQVAQWLCLTFLLGPDFFRHPDIDAYLHDSEISTEEKLDELLGE